MKKVQIHVCIDYEIYTRLKYTGINISGAINELLYNYLNIETKDETINELNDKIKRLSKDKDENAANMAILQSKLLQKKKELEDSEKQNTIRAMAAREEMLASGILEKWHR